MSLNVSLPGVRQPVIEAGGTASRPYYVFFQSVATSLQALSDQIGNVTTTPAESPISENANVVGKYSIYTRGLLKTGIVSVLLIGDVETPDPTQYYGSNADGEKGWHAVSDALDSTDNITLTVGTDGITTFDLADLADSGTGAALVKITRDSKGRIAGTSAATTTDLVEGVNLYYTDGRADARIAAQKGLANGLAPLGGDGKISTSYLPAAVLGQVSYQGTWDASAGTPPTSTPSKGWYYIVTVAGSTALDGITDWKVGDWAIYNGTAWNKVDNTDAVVTVNGYTGAVTLTAADVGAVQSVVAGTNVSVDNTDPRNPVVSAMGGGSSVVDTSFKNRLVNGDFSINQRVFAGGALAAGVYGYDRWKAGTGGCNVTLNATTGVLTHTSGPHVQVLEAPNLAGKTVTVSVEDPSGSITVDVDGVSGTITSGLGRRGVSLNVPSGSTGNVTLTITATGVTYKRVQLEVGTASTEWDQRHPSVELAMCQRYYQKTYKLTVKPGSASTNGEIPLVFMASTASAAASIPLAVRMRAAPALSYYDRAGNASKVSVDAANSVSIVAGGIYATDNLLTADFDSVTGLRARFHVVLDAEL